MPGNAQPRRRRQRLHQPPARLVRTADHAHLARRHQIVERRHMLVIRHAMIRPVRLVEIDIVRLQPLQARLNRAHHVVPVQRRHAFSLRRLDPAMARTRNLRRDQHGVARLGLDPAPDNLLRPPRILGVRRHRIVLGRVVEGDPRLERLVENAMRHRLIGLVAERHSPHADVGHVNRATAQAAAFHGIVPALPARDSDVSKRSQGLNSPAIAASAQPCCTACGDYRVASG